MPEEQMGKLKKHLDGQFADFIIIGIDSNDEFGSCINVGIMNESSISNRDRVTEMVGQIEIVKYEILGDAKIVNKNEFFEYFKDVASEVFNNYVIIGIDLLGETQVYYTIIKERKARLLGELGEIQLQLQLGSIGFVQLSNEDNPEEPEW